MQLRTDKLIFIEKLFLIIYLFMIILKIYMCGGMQQIDYYTYKIDQDGYQIVEATIIGINEKSITLRGYGIPYFTITKLEVCYKINGKSYIEGIYTYDDKKECKEIKLAVKKSNVKKVKRCIPYVLMKDNFIKALLQAMKIFGIAISMFILLNLFILYQKKQESEKALKNVNEKLERDKEREVDEKIKKQEMILSYCLNANRISLSRIRIDDAMKKLNIEFSDDFIWCLENLAGQECFFSILLFSQSEEGYEFEQVTIQLRGKGLPYNYYVIARYGENYLCGNKESSRIFCFSQSLGITNTQYTTIYDYILKNVNEYQCVK